MVDSVYTLVPPRASRVGHRLLRLVRSDLVAAMVIALLFAAVFGLRTAFYNPNDGLGLFFCIPVTVASIRFGPRVGIGCGLLAFGLFAVWARAHADVGYAGYLSRITVFVIIGSTVGYFARARGEIDSRSRRLFDLSPDFMGTIDDHGRLTSANDTWERNLGLSVEQLQGTPLSSLIDPWRLPAKGERARAFDSKLQASDGRTIWVEWLIRREPRHSRSYVVGRDVTERKVRSQHIELLLAQLHTVRDSERNRICADLHDFVLQNLLVALMHTEQLALTGPEGGDHHLATIDKLVRDATSSLRRMIDGISPLALDHTSVGDALHQAASNVEADYGLTVAADIEVSDDLSGDNKLLAYRLTMEILRNVAKHAFANRVHLVARDTSREISVSVEDDGRGFFEPVSIRNAASPLLGNSFTLLLEQALSHGGTFSIESSPGEGTVARFALPR